MPFGVGATRAQVLALALMSYKSLMGGGRETYLSPYFLFCKEG